MPTGYTASIATGEITTLKDFALLAARGMGALVTMREDNASAPIPEQLEPSSYHKDKLAEIDQKIKDALATPVAEWAVLAAKAQTDQVISNANYHDRMDAQRKRYEDMIAKVLDWKNPPEGLREFMLEQLQSSLDFDCKPIKNYPPSPELLSPIRYQSMSMNKLMDERNYHREQWAAELKRTAERNKWLRQLHDSLK